MTEQQKVQLTDAQWRERLTPEQYQIMRQKGTERPFTGVYDTLYEDGVYKCAGCGETLFDSDSKFSSGSGWPSFTRPADDGVVGEHTDGSFGMRRTEVVCSGCGAHLGHKFPDGPVAQGGQRYCINSASLQFDKGPEGV